MAHLVVHGSSHAGDEQAPLLGQGVFSQQATRVEPRDDVHGIRVVTLTGDELRERAGGSAVLSQPQGDPLRFAEVMVLEDSLQDPVERLLGLAYQSWAERNHGSLLLPGR